MKVIHLIESGGLYGAEKVLITLCQEHIRAGNCVTVLSVRKNLSDMNQLDSELKRLSIDFVPIIIKKSSFLIGAKKIASEIEKFGADIVHCHGYKANFFSYICKKKFSGNVKFVTTLHGYTGDKFLSKKTIIKFIDLRIARTFDKVFVVNDNLSRMIARKKSKGQVIKISNGVGEIISEARPFVNKDSLRIGAVGRISAEKNISFLINAAKEIKRREMKYKITIWGEGEERKKLEEYALDNELDSVVRFQGYCKNISDAFDDIDVFVNCSISEGMPITIIEAMSAKRLILAADIPANVQLLSGGEYGYLYRGGSIQSFLSCLETITTDWKGSQRLIDLAYQKYLKEHTEESLGISYLEEYRKLLNSGVPYE